MKEEPPRVMHSYAGVKRTETFINQDPHLSSPPERQKYYFQPTMNHSEMAKNIVLPSTGELVPVAVPLGKPRQDPTLRMPIPSTVGPRNLPPALEDKGNLGTYSLKTVQTF